MATNLDYFQKKLEEEKSKIEKTLSQIAERSPANPSDWEPTPPKYETQISEQTELADTFEEFGNRSAIEAHLEERLNNILRALERVRDKTYGICSVCNKPIDEKRLEANPSAATCVDH